MKIENRLYQKIIRSMPIPCVDLLVTDSSGRVLMLKRSEAPAKGEWWFPGGRILYRELRIDTAKRKLREECGLRAEHFRELGTYDMILDERPSGFVSHGITTVFHAVVKKNKVRLNKESTDYAWKTVNGWMKEVKHAFLVKMLKLSRTI